MAEDKELYGYEEDDIITLEYDNGEEEECGIVGGLHRAESTGNRRGIHLRIQRV